MISLETPFTPEDVDYDPDRLVVLQNHFQRMMDAGEIQSANFCLSRNGKVFANRAMGRISFRPEDTRELRPDTVQGIASITKLFTAVAIFKLLEDGRIRLNQPVGDFLKEFATPPFSTISPAMLLSHTSGLFPDGGCFENKYQLSAWDYMAHRKDISWLEAALSPGLRTKPGSEWAYCSFGYVVLGEIISRVTGQDCHEYILKQICEPLGMSDTAFFHPAKDPSERARQRALFSRFNIRGEEMERRLRAAAEGKEEADEAPFDKVPMTGGGLISTAADLNRFGVMLLNKGSLDGRRILGRRGFLRMVEPYTGPEIRDYCWGAGGSRRDYALGPDKRRGSDSLYSQGTFFHEGAGACCLIVDPEEGLVASWFVPFNNDQWHAHGLYNAAAIMWSGLR